MIEKLRQLRATYDALQSQMQDPAVFGDPTQLKKIGKDIARLEPFLPLFREYESALAAIDAERELGEDPELGEAAKAEADVARLRLPELEKDLQKFLVPPDPNDDRDVMLEVRAGAGGNEAALFAAELLRMYIRYAENCGWTTEMVDTSLTDGGGLKEASVRIVGDGVYGKLKFESGVHRVQRIPETENKGRVHTSTATVAILPEAEEQDVVIKNEDLRIDTYRAGGAGGQHVNKTESAVRITHIPTGTVVACQTERSQVKNKMLAMSLLRSRIYAAEQERKAKEQSSARSAQVGSGERSDRIRTCNFPQDRLTDHRAGESFHNLPSIMEGNIGDIVDALRKWDWEMRSSANS